MSPKTARKLSFDVPRFLRVVAPAFYTNVTTVLDELLQNAQRAGATSVTMEFRDGGFTIQDNGVGLTDFTPLLTIAKTGWSATVQDAETPFGMGFWSVILLARKVVVRSHRKVLEIDAHRMREDGVANAMVEYATMDEPVDGFSVEVEVEPSFVGTKYKADDFRHYARALLTFLPLKAATFVDRDDDTEVPTFTAVTTGVDVASSMGMKHEEVFQEAPYRGCLAIHEGDWANVEVIVRGRLVTRVYTSGIKGRVEVAPEAISLRAPDRKDIVYDDKKVALEAAIERFGTSAARRWLLSGERIPNPVANVLAKLLGDEDVASVPLRLFRAQGLDEVVEQAGKESTAHETLSMQSATPVLHTLPPVAVPRVQIDAEPLHGATTTRQVDEPFFYVHRRDLSSVHSTLLFLRRVGALVVICENDLEVRAAKLRATAHPVAEAEDVILRRVILPSSPPALPPAVGAGGAVLLGRLSRSLGILVDVQPFEVGYTVGGKALSLRDAPQITIHDGGLLLNSALFVGHYDFSRVEHRVGFTSRLLLPLAHMAAALDASPTSAGHAADVDRRLRQLLTDFEAITCPAWVVGA